MGYFLLYLLYHIFNIITRYFLLFLIYLSSNIFLNSFIATFISLSILLLYSLEYFSIYFLKDFSERTIPSSDFKKSTFLNSPLLTHLIIILSQEALISSITSKAKDSLPYLTPCRNPI